MNLPNREPTSDECTDYVAVVADNGDKWTACWYPQMGGYIAKCWVRVEAQGCFDALVYHDGDWPFSDEWDRGSPRLLHHCDTNQFREFADAVDGMTP